LFCAPTVGIRGFAVKGLAVRPKGTDPTAGNHRPNLPAIVLRASMILTFDERLAAEAQARSIAAPSDS